MTKIKSCILTLSLLLALGLGSQAAFAQTPDPSKRGPFTPVAEEYNLGDQAFTPAGFPTPVEIRAVVFHPMELAKGPFPIVIYLHGRHSTCFSGATSFLEWPCAAGHQPILSFRGYDYSADQLATHGYFVVSISANGINASDDNVSDLGASARAQLIQRHLDLWKQFNTIGGSPFGTKFVGTVDLTRVGTMGHSRGGEGVLRHFIFNQTQPSPYPVKVVVAIAPTDFSRWQVNKAVAVAQLLSYCDGDVTSIQGVHAFDDARYKMDHGGYQQYVAVMGGDHNFYNSNWTPGSDFPAADDWVSTGDSHCGTVAGNGRLTAPQQRSVALAYLSSFFRSELGGETAFKPLIDGTGGFPPSVSAFGLNVSYQPADAQRRDLNRLQTAADLSTNFLGGGVAQFGLSPHDMCGGPSPQPQHCLTNQSTARQPHTAPTSISTARGLPQLRTGWSGARAVFANSIPAGPNRDISSFEFLQFRTTVNFADPRNPGGQPQDFSIRFTDGNGARQSLRVGQFSRALFFPPGTTGPVPKVWHNTVRIPLASLTAVDKAFIAGVEMLFDQSTSGALLISDLHFYDSDGAPPPTQIFFDDFETIQGWTANPNGTDTATTGRWEVANPEPTDSAGPKQLGTTVSGVSDLVTAAAAGTSAGINDIDGGVTSIQSPAITLSGSGTFTLSFFYYLAHGSNSSADDFFRVKIVSSSTTTTVFEELGSATNKDAAFVHATVNLSQFAGQTIKILIEASDNAGGSLVEAAVDDVKITRQ